jgi:hypothetical protein
MHFVTERKQVLGQIRSVLSRDTADERLLHACAGTLK